MSNPDNTDSSISSTKSKINSYWRWIAPNTKVRDSLDLLVSNNPAFEGLTTSERLTLKRVLHKRIYSADEVVFNKGEPGLGMYLILEGKVSIFGMDSDGNKMEYAVLKKGQFIGELALLEEVPRSASAECLEDTILFGFFRPDLQDLVERKPAIAAKILQNVGSLMGKRLRLMNEELHTLQSSINSGKA